MNRKQNQFQCRYWMPCFWILLLMGWFQGCATSSNETISSSRSSWISERPVSPSRELTRQQEPFSSDLPFGIGARFDLMVADTASDMNDFYSSYVKPLQRGKIFNRQPYQIDYSILPSQGEAFGTKKNSFLSSVNMRSDYKIQVGVSRRFEGIADFFKPAFWLGTGAYSTANPRRKPASNSNSWHALAPEDPFNDPVQTTDFPHLDSLDMDSFLNNRGDLDSTE